MEAEFVKSVYTLKDLPRERMPEIAVAGKSNVGKSSLLNKLVGKRGLAKTSQTPGKTHCLNFFRIVPERGAPFHLVDLPGYGYAKVSQSMRDDWGKLIDAFLAHDHRPNGLIALFDARREPTQADLDWIAWLAEWGKPYLVVLTKADKLSGNERAQSMRRWSVADPATPKPIVSSAVTAMGLDRIWQWIDDVRAAARRAA